MLQTLFNNPLKQSLSQYTETVKAINTLEKTIEKLTQDEIQSRTRKLQAH